MEWSSELFFVLSMCQLFFCKLALGWSSSGSLERIVSLMNPDKSHKFFSHMIVLVFILSLSEGI